MIYLDEIRPQFEKGGTITDKKYKSILRQVANENYLQWEETPEHAYQRMLNDPSYDYRVFIINTQTIEQMRKLIGLMNLKVLHIQHLVMKAFIIVNIILHLILIDLMVVIG